MFRPTRDPTNDPGRRRARSEARRTPTPGPIIVPPTPNLPVPPPSQREPINGDYHHPERTILKDHENPNDIQILNHPQAAKRGGKSRTRPAPCPASPTSSTSSHISHYDILSPPEAQPRESESPAPARAQPRLRDTNQNLFVGVHGEGDGGPEVQGLGYRHRRELGSKNGAEGGMVRPISRNALPPRQGHSGLRNVLVPEEDGDGDQAVSFSSLLSEISDDSRGRVLLFDYDLLLHFSTTTLAKARAGARSLIRVCSSPAASRWMTRRTMMQVGGESWLRNSIKRTKQIVTVKTDEFALHQTTKRDIQPRTTSLKDKLLSAPTCSTNTATELYRPLHHHRRRRLLLHSHARGNGLLCGGREQAGRQ